MTIEDQFKYQMMLLELKNNSKKTTCKLPKSGEWVTYQNAKILHSDRKYLIGEIDRLKKLLDDNQIKY